jgi:hypothetical protein
MSDAIEAGEQLQAAVLEILQVAFALLASESPPPLGSSVKFYDHVPQYDETRPNSQYPYGGIGEIDYQDWGTKTEPGQQFEGDIELYSRYRGRKELLAIRRVCYAVLHEKNITLGPGLHCVLFRVERASTERMQDGATYRSVMRYSALVENVASG